MEGNAEDINNPDMTEVAESEVVIDNANGDTETQRETEAPSSNDDVPETEVLDHVAVKDKSSTNGAFNARSDDSEELSKVGESSAISNAGEEESEAVNDGEPSETENGGGDALRMAREDENAQEPSIDSRKDAPSNIGEQKSVKIGAKQ